MTERRAPDPVKVFAAVLRAPRADMAELRRVCCARWGPIDHEGLDRPFDVTDYYDAEMGSGLRRRIVSFEPLVQPEELIRLKLEAIAIEDDLRQDGGRVVNVDVGYFDIHKIVLGSVKYDAQKIHLGEGVWADIVARFYEGEYRPYDWTFPDLRDRRYDEEFGAIRAIYKRQLRAIR